ncbi:MAG: hypothetical protein N2439_15570, partial [Anaerolineae bacterium]|nr:hypothetical protein [Anaerolineae bacterium]
PAPTPAPTTFIPAEPSYARGSNERDAYDLLMAERARCGFGTLQQNPILDAAAANQAEYRKNNSGTHYQTPGTPGFLGITPTDRALALGYRGVVGEYGSNGGPWPELGTIGQQTVWQLLSVPYHSLGVIGSGTPEFGIGFSTPIRVPFFPELDGPLAALTFGIPTTGPLAGKSNLVYAPGEVKHYPCEGVNGIPTKVGQDMGEEIPNPIANRDWQLAPTGPAIVVQSAPGTLLALGTATLVEVATGARVPVLPPTTRANDPNPEWGLLGPNHGFYFPDVPLKRRTTYRFTFDVAVNGGATITKSFTFTTGAR